MVVAIVVIMGSASAIQALQVLHVNNVMQTITILFVVHVWVFISLNALYTSNMADCEANTTL